MPDATSQNPKGRISSNAKQGEVTEELSKGIFSSQAKHGEISPLKDSLSLSKGKAIGSESFFRITEQGVLRIVEESLALRIIENAP